MRFSFRLLSTILVINAISMAQPETPSVTVTPSGGNVIIDTVWNKSHTSATFSFTAPDNSDQGRIYVIFTDDVSGSWSDANNPIRSESITPGGESITGYSSEWDDILFDANVNGKEFYWAIRCVNISTFQDIDTLYSKLYTIQNTTPDAPDTPDLKSESDTGTSSGDNVTNDNTPTFLVTGLNPAYTAVRLRQWYDGTLYTSETIDGATQKNLTITEALSDGTHYIHAEHVDQYGNEAFSSYITLTIDTQAPNAPEVPDLKSSSDSGWQSNDDYTNKPTPTFTINLSENEYYGYAGIKIDGTATDSSTITSGDYSSDDVTLSSSLSSGSYNITAFHRDRAGNKSNDSGPLSITIDTDSPSQPNIPDLQTASDGGFSSNDEITSNTTPTFDVSGVAAGDSIYILFGADTVARDLASSTNISLTISSAQSDGTYAVKAGAKDKAGNTATVSTSLSVTIDTQAPTKPGKPDLDSGSDSGVSSTDDLTNDSSPAFDLTGLSSGDSVYIRFDGDIVARTLAQGATIPDLEISPQADGTYSVTVTATDAAGNTSTASDALTLRIDTSSPSPPSSIDMLAADDSGESNSDDITSNRQPRFNISGITSGDSVLLKFDNVVKASGRATGTTIQLQPSAQLAGGTYSVTSVAIDSAGNTSNASGALSVTIDFTASDPSSAPDLQTTSDKGQFDDDNITSDSTVIFTVSGVIAGDSVFIELDGTVAGGAKVLTGQTTVDITVSDIDEGTYTVTAYTKDPAGNVSSDSPALNGFTVDTTPPSAPSSITLDSGSDTGISDSDGLTQQRKPTFNISGVTATDSILLKFDGVVKASQTATTSSIQLTPSFNQSQGTHSVTATAIDIAGNESTATSTYTLRIDITAPEPPNPPALLSDDDSGFSNTDKYTNVTRPRFVLTNLSTTRDSIRVFANGTINIISEVVSQGTSDTLQVSATAQLAEGTYSITAMAIDSAGNESTTSTELTNLIIDLTDPSSPSSIDLKSSSDTGTSNSDDLTKDRTPTFTISGVTSGDSIFVVMTETTSDTVGSSKATGTSVQVTINQISSTSGVFLFQTYAMDKAGNTSSVGVSPTLTVTLDAEAPSKPTGVDLLDADDSGMSSTDNLTNDLTPTFQVSGVSSTDSVYLVVGTDTVNRDIASDVVINLTPDNNLPEGLNTIKALRRDYAGNLSSPSTSLDVTIDTTAPNPPNKADLQPTFDSGFFNDDNVTKRDSLGFVIDGLTDGDSVTFFVNGVLKSFVSLGGFSAPIASSGKVGLLYLPPSPGSLLITSTVTDSAGNTSQSSNSLKVLLDQTSPDAPNQPDLKSTSDSGTLDDDNLTSDQTPTFTITGITAGDSIFIAIQKDNETDTTGRGFATTSSIDITLEDLTTDGITDDEGTFIIKAVAVDSAGNQSQVSQTLSVTVDVTGPDAPSISLVPGSDSGILSNDRLTNDTTPSFLVSSVAATDSVYLIVDADTTARGEVNLGEVNITLTSSQLSHNPGGYSVRAIGRDFAGNLGSSSATLTVRVDTDPPATLSAPDLLAASDLGFSDTDNITNKTAPSFIITGLHATDRDSVRILLDGSIGVAGVVSQGVRDTLQVSTQVSGSYNVYVVAIDSAGNVSDTSDTLLPLLVIDNIPPSTPSQPDLATSSDLGESSTDDLTSTTTPEITTNGLEQGSINKLYRINGVGDTTLTKVDTVDLGESSLSFIPDTPLPGDQYTFYVTSEDTAGNIVQSANLDGVIIDTQTPSAQIILSDSLVRMEDSPISVMVYFSEGMADPPFIYVLFSEGAEEDTTAMVPTAFDSVWSYSLAIPDTNDGTATISIIGEDNAGNELDSLNVSGRNLLRLDNTDPVFSSLAPDSGSFVNHARVSYTLSETVESGSVTWTWISGIPDDNSPHVAILQPFELAQATYEDIQLAQDPTLTPTPLVNDAFYRITWVATDSAGNSSINYIMSPVKYDTTGPSATLTYSSYVTMQDSVVTISATFNESALPTPQVTIDYAGGTVDGPNAMIITTGSDSTIWTYNATIPGGNDGTASVSITATDLAGNSLTPDSTFFTDTLLVDNTFPTVDSLASSDSLVKELDVVTFTAKFSESVKQSPQISIDFAGPDSMGATDMLMVQGTDSTMWTYTLLAVPDSNNGAATVTVSAIDLAGNPISDSNTDILILDNIHPIFSNITPDTGSFVNHTQIGYTLTDNSLTLDSARITWSPIFGPGSPVTSELVGNELQIGIHTADTLTNNPVLEDGTMYQLTFSGVDFAGNIGSVIVDSVTYDTTGPIVDSLTYSKNPAMPGDTVRIDAYFNEIVPNVPMVSIEWPNVGTEAVSLDSTVNGAMLQWFGSVIVQNTSGIATVTPVAQDRARNPIDSLAGLATLYDSTWVIDNSAPSCSLFYANVNQPNLTNLGKGGDEILITAKFSEKVKGAVLAPTLTIQFPDTSNHTIENQTFTTSLNSDSTWTYTLSLPTDSSSTGKMTVVLGAYDLAGNVITTITGESDFVIDNIPPAKFQTGSVVPKGKFAKVGWLNEMTDSVAFTSPINSQDTTLYLGKIQIRMKIDGVVTSLTTVGSPTPITNISQPATVHIRKDTIRNAFDPSDFVEGVKLLSWVELFDLAGNSTVGTMSTDTLVVDTIPPVKGTLVGGIAFSADTVISSDSVSAIWTGFSDEVTSGESGLDFYEWAVGRLGSSDLDSMMSWTNVNLDTMASAFVPLRHLESYDVSIRAVDKAGNISDTLKTSNGFLRLNSAPKLDPIDSQFAGEDHLFSYQVVATDKDTATLLGDTLHYFLLDTLDLLTGFVNPITIDEKSGLITWDTPLQADTGSYPITIVVNDEWNFADTTSFTLTDTSVNDTPVVSQINDIEFDEDDTTAHTLNLTQFVDDVDNNDTTEIFWSFEVKPDTNVYPTYPILGFEPGMPEALKSVVRSFISGGKLRKSELKLSIKSQKDVKTSPTRMWTNPGSTNLTVEIDTTTGLSIANFIADSNYYVEAREVVFYATDLGGAIDSSKMFVTIHPINDPPILEAVGDTIKIAENDTLVLTLRAVDIDDSSLVFTVIPDSSQIQVIIQDSIATLIPEQFWVKKSNVLVIVDDGELKDSTSFILNVLRVIRPHLNLYIGQNPSFTQYYELMITDTAEKTIDVSLIIKQPEEVPVPLDTVADYTWVAHHNFDTTGTFQFEVFADAVVGDTTLRDTAVLALAKAKRGWTASSADGKFQVTGDPGSVFFDQPFMIVDSLLFAPEQRDGGLYRMGHPMLSFKKPVLISLPIDTSKTDENQAIYQRGKEGIWKEVPTVTKGGRLLAWTSQLGYFKIGPKTLIVPEITALGNNYPNPFNAITNIVFDIGFFGGPNQKVTVKIYNLLGQEVRTLTNDELMIGHYEMTWNGKNNIGNTVSSGVYIVRMATNRGISQTQKMMLLR